MNVNYKSDFKLLESGCDFSVPFTFEYRTVFGREYVASHIDGFYTNCYLHSDGRLMVCFDDHNLPPGILTCTRHFYLTDEDFHNGICNLWDKRDTGIILTIGKTDNCEIEVEVPPFYNKGSKGDPGITPHIGENYNWWIGEEDTGVLAKGQNGSTPSIGNNGNWYINGEDTGKPSQGVQGENGANGADGTNGKDGADGEDGKTPILEIGQVSTLSPDSLATVSLTPDGTDLQGNPKYQLNFGIPKGENGTSEEIDNITLSSLSDLNQSWENLLKSEPDFATTSSNVASATKLQIGRSIWGQNFDGTKSLSGDMSNVSSISMDGNLSGVKTLTGGNVTLSIDSSPGYNIGFRLGGSQNNAFCLIDGGLQPYYNSRNALNFGAPDTRWKTIYVVNAVDASSDIRLKDICTYINIELDKIAQAKIFSYKWKDKRIKDIQIGCSAQYWKDIIPEAIKEDCEGYLSMAYDRIALASAISIAREVVNLNKKLINIESKIIKN
ncbi:MAG: tail fiber domain-containing protein [Candidatus Bacteroides intestinipullorum]|uniref:Tail fiber domain-containing protein n=1 Tax=Candidatus Bacteroides intestinipullorum TaxID=2838471 RepID=A0A9E2KFM7_9BACE|nr:tail fiber domain-containing protein [Candidatus Bacteroides intestinipullorum]